MAIEWLFNRVFLDCGKDIRMKIFVLPILLLAFTPTLSAEESELLNYFQGKNPEITEVVIIEYVSNDKHPSGLLVARGRKPSNTFTGDWNDELFGIFHTNKDKNIVNVLEFIPTKRWHDYCASVKKKGLNSYLVSFYGCTYKDERMEIEYKIE